MQHRRRSILFHRSRVARDDASPMTLTALYVFSCFSFTPFQGRRVQSRVTASHQLTPRVKVSNFSIVIPSSPSSVVRSGRGQKREEIACCCAICEGETTSSEATGANGFIYVFRFSPVLVLLRHRTQTGLSQKMLVSEH